MRKPELIAVVARQHGIPEAKAAEIVNSVFQTITKTLAEGDEVAISGFGTFRVATRAGRTTRNPRSGEPMRVAPGKSPRFSPGAALKRAVDPQ
ncbi:MAG TPA: HU family DNA-binding protein [Thermomicrobiales bacterium]|nr:HU family DNA-binding protein [Thermomicrobiales bacterium]